MPPVRRENLPHPGRGQSVVRCRDRALFYDGIPPGSGVLERVVSRRIHHRMLSRSIPKLVLCPVGDEHGVGEPDAFPAHLGPRAGARRARRADAQEQGQRDLVRRGRGSYGRGRDAVDVCRKQSRGQYPFRIRPGGSGQAKALDLVAFLQFFRHVRASRWLRSHKRRPSGRGPVGAGPVAHGQGERLGPGRPRGVGSLQRDGGSQGGGGVFGGFVQLVHPAESPAFLEKRERFR